MKKFTKIFSVIALCAVMIIMSVVPAFASQYEHVENHDVIDCANRYVDGNCYKFLIKIPESMSLSNVTIHIYGGSGSINYITSLSALADSAYASIDLEYNHSGSNYYMLTIDTSSSEIPSSLVHKMGIMLFCVGGYMATNTANGSFTYGPGYWLSK